MNERQPVIAENKRGPWPHLRPSFDLTQNVETAREIVKAVDPFFHFVRTEEKGEPTFSGHARRSDEYDGTNPLLYVQVWRKGALYRSFAFRDVGYVGVLNVRSPGHWPGFDHDYLESIFEEFSENCNVLPEGTDKRTLCLIDSSHLTLSIPWRF